MRALASPYMRRELAQWANRARMLNTRVPTRLRAGGDVEALGLRPSRVDDLVDHVDDTVVALDVALVAGARGRGHGGTEGVVDEVLAEHAAVGDLGALDRGEVGAGEGVGADDTRDDVVPH